MNDRPKQSPRPSETPKPSPSRPPVRQHERPVITPKREIPDRPLAKPVPDRPKPSTKK